MTSLVLEENETLTASVVVNATPEAVFSVFSDVTRIPEWSPETVRTAWTEPGKRFASWNRRRLALWKTPARVTSLVPGRELAFVVEIPGFRGVTDWTAWTYRVEPGGVPGTSVLTEEFRMCMRLPFAARAYEFFFLFVRDRRTDLQANLQTCVERIRDLAQAGEA